MFGQWTRLKFQKATGAVAVATTLAPNRTFRLMEVRIHLSGVANAENLTIKLDSAAGAAYDVTLKTQAMSGLTDFVWRASDGDPIMFTKGDEIDIAFANTATDTYGLEIVYQEL